MNAELALRIGIHTASAFMGDIGNGEKIEFTVMGAGVNFARRLQEACDPYRIMISSGTLGALSIQSATMQRGMFRRDVGIKHYENLFEAYEINTFLDEPARINEALKRHTSLLGKQRTDERYMSSNDSQVKIIFPLGSGQVNDFSRTGARVTVDFYVASGVLTTMIFESPNAKFINDLTVNHLAEVQVLVRWGKPIAEGKFSLGLQFVGLHGSQADILVGLLRSVDEDSLHASIRGSA